MNSSTQDCISKNIQIIETIILYRSSIWWFNRGQEQQVVVENGTERAEGGESESELDLLAEVETESDSDDQDNAESAQRSVQTGATQGSDAGIYNYAISCFLFSSKLFTNRNIWYL